MAEKGKKKCKNCALRFRRQVQGKEGLEPLSYEMKPHVPVGGGEGRGLTGERRAG